MKNSSGGLAVVNIALVTYKLFAGGDPRRIGTQIDVEMMLWSSGLMRVTSPSLGLVTQRLPA